MKVLLVVPFIYLFVDSVLSVPFNQTQTSLCSLCCDRVGTVSVRIGINFSTIVLVIKGRSPRETLVNTAVEAWCAYARDRSFIWEILHHEAAGN